MGTFSFVLIFGCLPLFADTPVKSSRFGENSIYNKVEKINVIEKTVEFGDKLRIIAVPVKDLNPEYYYQNKDKVSPKIDVDELAEKTAEIVIKKLLEIGNTRTGPTVENPVILNTYQLVEKRCATCHSGDTPAGDLSFVNKDRLVLEDKSGILNERDIASLMFDVAAIEETMPKNGAKLTPEEKKVLRDYSKYLLKKVRENQ